MFRQVVRLDNFPIHEIQYGINVAELEDSTEKSTSFIIFKLPSSAESLTFLRKEGWSTFGIIGHDFNTNELIFTVTGNRKVIGATNIFLDKLKKNSITQKLMNELKVFQRQCSGRLQQKPQKSPPSKSKNVSNFTIGELKEGTANLTAEATKNGKEYIFKLNRSGRPISQFETFNSFCYRLLLGDRHPKVRAIHDDIGSRVGVVSRKIPKFKSLTAKKDYFNDNAKEKIINAEIVKVWAAAYIEEECDLHSDNYGFGADKFCVKIDDDETTWPLTANYCGDFFAEYIFPVTGRDILEFPVLTNANPYHWPGKERDMRDRIFSLNLLNELIEDEKFMEDKFYIFLKRILIPDQVYTAIAQATIDKENNQNKFANHKQQKTQALRDALFVLPQFQNYIIRNQNIINKIISEFEEYNKEFKKDADAGLRVDTDTIRNTFNAINEDMHTRKGLLLDDTRKGFFRKMLDKLNIHPLWYVLIGIGIAITIGATLAIIMATHGAAVPGLISLGALVGGKIIGTSAATLTVAAAAVVTPVVWTGFGMLAAGFTVVSALAFAAGGWIVKKINEYFVLGENQTYPIKREPQQTRQGKQKIKPRKRKAKSDNQAVVDWKNNASSNKVNPGENSFALLGSRKSTSTLEHSTAPSLNNHGI